MTKLRFAQAGVTAIHGTMYRETLQLMADMVEIVAFYDPDPAAVRPKLAPALQDVPFYPSVAALAAEARPDAILVSAPNTDMPGLAIPAAEAGVHIWLEKPCAAHSSQLLPLADAIERHHLAFSTGYSWRFHPVCQLIRETVAAGLLGDLYSIEVRFITSSVRRRGTSNWGFQRAIAGGGILNWLGCHWFDLMRFLTNAEVTRVAAIEANVGRQPIDVEDAAAVALRFDNGMIGSLHTGFLTPGESELWVGLRGSEGWVRWDLDSNACTIKSTRPAWLNAPLRTYNLPMPAIAGYGPEGLALMQQFCAAIRGEGSSGYTVADAIAALRIIEAAHDSAAEARTITLHGAEGAA
ncbi:MAG TPA: Gfo/Idh/MocA family oxidoreductase [Roseiflexaceae bacterium]|nr:Gfo/Idh/MocA family oxidoreductase [Roseiflexaceae bacterium]HMP42661.1 Gfo/Idh/MocA family oxidoreductase [Roseiflexaceae bacterium]